MARKEAGCRGCVGFGGGVHPWSIGGVHRWSIGAVGRDCGNGGIQEMLECSDVLGWVGYAFESRRTIGDGLHEFIGRGERGVSDRFVLKHDCITKSVAVGRFDMAFVGVVMFG